jgi:hypothetical protein
MRDGNGNIKDDESTYRGRSRIGTYKACIASKEGTGIGELW